MSEMTQRPSEEELQGVGESAPTTDSEDLGDLENPSTDAGQVEVDRVDVAKAAYLLSDVIDNGNPDEIRRAFTALQNTNLLDHPQIRDVAKESIAKLERRLQRQLADIAKGTADQLSGIARNFFADRKVVALTMVNQEALYADALKMMTRHFGNVEITDRSDISRTVSRTREIIAELVNRMIRKREAYLNYSRDHRAAEIFDAQIRQLKKIDLQLMEEFSGEARRKVQQFSELLQSFPPRYLRGVKFLD